MQQRTFVTALLLPHSPLEAILSHPILLLKSDSLATDPFSYFGHLVGVINFKDFGSSYYFDWALLFLELLCWDRQYFWRLLVSLKEKPVEVFGTFGLFLRLDNMALVEIGQLSDLRTHSQEFGGLQGKIQLSEAA
jgi:hypothetical protein